jgi:hypothetical protein
MMWAFTAVSAHGATIVELIIVAVIIIVPPSAVIASHGIVPLPVIAVLIPTIRDNLPALLAVVVIVFIYVSVSSGHLSLLSIPHNNHTGILLARHNYRCGRCVLQYDLLRLRGLLADDNRRRWWRRWRVICGFLAVTLNIVAVVVVEPFFDPLLNLVLLIMVAAMRAPVPVSIRLLALVDGNTRAICVFVIVAVEFPLVIRGAHTVSVVRLKR